MGLFLAFLFGVGNFAAHRAVLNSDHPMLARAPWLFQMMGGRFSLALEFIMLLGAMLMIAQGSTSWAWIYAFYSAVNLGAAWLIVTKRI
ncbi:MULTISPECIES: hypothetical protein [unclassified Novosphingobium]|uniref:hypothetical protein n=1 Tax=unclassified Novosphingobium TaxID=2644732 RepID=UPI0025E0D6D0|nr:MULTISPECIES: hypothetical protein [unclassified Novosphingobium]HQV02396.1 hypothetical protein [Novosphingobium sp.]